MAVSSSYIATPQAFKQLTAGSITATTAASATVIGTITDVSKRLTFVSTFDKPVMITAMYPSNLSPPINGYSGVTFDLQMMTTNCSISVTLDASEYLPPGTVLGIYNLAGTPTSGVAGVTAY